MGTRGQVGRQSQLVRMSGCTTIRVCVGLGEEGGRECKLVIWTKGKKVMYLRASLLRS